MVARRWARTRAPGGSRRHGRDRLSDQQERSAAAPLSGGAPQLRPDALFTVPDHRFHLGYLTEERADRDAAEAIGLLGLHPPADILDAGCGDGRLTVRLAALGFRVLGVDHDAEQVARAAERCEGSGAALRTAPIEDGVGESCFDGALLWFNTWGFLSDEMNAAVLRSIARSLRPGGCLVIDSLHRRAVERDLLQSPGEVRVSMGDDLQVDDASFDANTGRLETLRWTRVDGEERVRRLSLRLPRLKEWPGLLAEVGLELESATGRAGAPLDDEEPCLVLLARKRS
jgi:SAM-dependent methyltransferase